MILAGSLADTARVITSSAFRQDLKVSAKSDSSLVTEIDIAVEQAIRERLVLERPDDVIVGEELGNCGQKSKESRTGLTWIIDPIDGTVSFVSGRAAFVLLIGVWRDGIPLLGLIDQPILQERWIGASGWGTWYNGCRASTRECLHLSGATLSATSPSMFVESQDLDLFGRVTRAAQATVYGGDGYAYGLLASGYQDLIVEAGLKLHDFAAMPPIIEGAGGIITDWCGDLLTGKSDGRVLVAGDSRVHEQVLLILQSSEIPLG